MTKKDIKDAFMYVLAALVVTYAFIFLYMLFFYEIPTTNRDIVTTLSGAIVSGGFTAIIMYFFGSSRGSAAKDEAMTEKFNK